MKEKRRINDKTEALNSVKNYLKTSPTKILFNINNFFTQFVFLIIQNKVFLIIQN